LRLGRRDLGDHPSRNELPGLVPARLNLDAALHDADRSARRLYGHDELGALHQGRQIGRAHAEMRRRLLFDLEQRAPEILDHLDQALLAPGLGKAQLGPRPDDDIFRSPHQHRPAPGSAEDQFARL
jgi:hypothetical protein